MKELGKIARIEYGFGGYQDAQFGMTISFSTNGGGGGVGTFDGPWASEPKPGLHKWTLEDQSKGFAATARLIRDTLKKAGKQHLAELVGVPVELDFGDAAGSTWGTRLTSWRVLEEVL